MQYYIFRMKFSKENGSQDSVFYHTVHMVSLVHLEACGEDRSTLYRIVVWIPLHLSLGALCFPNEGWIQCPEYLNYNMPHNSLKKAFVAVPSTFQTLVAQPQIICYVYITLFSKNNEAKIIWLPTAISLSELMIWTLLRVLWNVNCFV